MVTREAVKPKLVKGSKLADAMMAAVVGPDPQEVDPFVQEVQDAISRLLQQALDPKDMNAAIANAIKLIAAKAKISGDVDGGSFWGGDD